MIICESMSPERRLGIRSFCPCCAGGKRRGRFGLYSMIKSKSHRKNKKARKPRYKDHRSTHGR